MAFLTLARTELKRLVATPMARLALVALMLVPVLYAGLYLWGNDDPYGNLDEVPVALVVQDEGATQNGEDVDYGDQVRDELVADGSLDWTVTSQEEAEDGIRSGEYDFIVTFGPDFSRALTSVAGDDPERAVVELTTNDSNSYLAGTIADQVTEKVRASLTQEVGEEAARTLLDGLATVRAGLVDAADGAATLADGTASARDGADALAEGSASAADGASDLAEGLTTLRDATAGLPSQTARLNDGAQQVADGNAQLSGTVQPVAQQIADAVANLPTEDEVRARLEGTGLDETQIQAVLDIVSPVRTDLESANDQVQTAAGSIQQLADGSAQVAAGTQQLADGMPALADGVSGAQSGATELSDGVQQLAEGSATLDDGLGDIDDGAVQLRDGLQDAVGRIPDQSEDERETAARMIADPVQVSSDAITEASSYGAGMAPFFISLAAWIGIYALFLIVKPYSKRAVTALRRPLPITLAAWAAPAALGVLQMVVVFGVVALGLGYSVAHPWGMLGFMALTSATFAAVILTLNVMLGSVGQFLGLVLMVLQLVTAGGTFPYQTLPTPLRALHEALPMSHAVEGIRQVMYGGDLARAWADAGFLGLWLAAALLVAYLVTFRMTRSRTLRDLRPSLIG
ncbi:YhgE/Pip domain-containing protein [Microbacterium betulae]|uniref:YhgE/Pip domain-containing protein n=1 Tax=Microbacterium betulae TaxID=2981139 RepID=A0AA97FLC2_9MICO|nr:YhgE/Pip domain-containing protein [Microbacterium sp. AB]WOF24395.1 YhgE/Pip domain-containing protein [Microbacterium sp. AB]